MSYFQDPLDSQLGVLYGLELAVPVFERGKLHGAFSHNHFDLGSQFLGTLGTYHQGLPEGEFLERFSCGLLFDQYTDTRFDGLYLSQFRYFAGFAPSERFSFGITYTNPLEDADSLDLALPTIGTGPVTLHNAEIVEGYLSLQHGRSQLTTAIGQRQAPNELVVSLFAVHQLSSQFGLYSNSSYSDSRLWAASVGLQWTFGSGTSRVDSTPDSGPILVRGQDRRAPTNPFRDTSLGHNLNLDAQRFGSLLTFRSMGQLVAPNSRFVGPTPDGNGFSDEIDGDAASEPHGGGFVGTSVTESY